jgi:aminopeptidase N
MSIPSFREHQTIPSIGRGLIEGSSPVWDLGSVANVIAHDMAHQWFGDSLTPKDWSDVWLNEGFANYAVALWHERSEGEAAYRAFMRSLRVDSSSGPVFIAPDRPPGALLTFTTFNKGAWVLHMLRHVMGDRAFFRALRDYVRTGRGGLVDTESWLSACQKAYGRPLGWFFKEWVYGGGRPHLHSAWKPDIGGGGARVHLTIDQTQPGPAFMTPIDVELVTEGGRELRTVWLHQRHQEVELTADTRVENVVLDPDDWLLKG